MAHAWTEEWADPLEAIFTEFGESCVWVCAADASEHTLGGIVTRNQRGRTALPETGRGRFAANSDATRVRGDGALTVRTSDLPALAASRDVVRVPTEPGGSTLEIWVVGEQEQAQLAGTMKFILYLGGQQQPLTPGMEQE